MKHYYTNWFYTNLYFYNVDYRERRMAKNGCCTTNCLKNALNFFNLLFLFAALGLLITTVWTLNNHFELINLLSSSTYSVLLDFLLVAGTFLLIVSFLGCYAVIKENRRLFIIYIFLLLLIILLEFMVALLGYVYKENLNDELKMNLNKTMLENYGVDGEKTEAINLIQQKFFCCGAVQFEDWEYSTWRLTNVTKNLVPDSCCKTISTSCGVRDHPSNIYYDGCIGKIEGQMVNNLMVIICVGLGVGLSEIIGIILAFKLYLNLKEDIDINELRQILHNT